MRELPFLRAVETEEQRQAELAARERTVSRLKSGFTKHVVSFGVKLDKAGRFRAFCNLCDERVDGIAHVMTRPEETEQ